MVIILVVSVFFFFKQKTAYEITRDWSSDVCSSDLLPSGPPTIEFDQTQFEALAEHIGADELRSIIDGFLEDTGRLLEQVERAADRQQNEEQARLLESLRE